MTEHAPIWNDVIGQDAVVELLARAASDPSAMSHAWLVTGPPGSGRSVAARAFAAALQCDRPEGVEPGCGHCPACVTVVAGTNADVRIVATDKVTIAIDEVRDLVMLGSTSPSGGKYRVIIIEDADRMAERTTNVLLKAIEEPPPHTVWILCAPSPGDVLPTIRSRCRHVGLRVPPVDEVAALLERRDGVEPGVALAAARAAQGHVGVARWLAKDPAARKRRLDTLECVADIGGVGSAVVAADRLLALAKEEAAASTADVHAQERARLLRDLGLSEGQKVPPAMRAQIKAQEDDQKRRATRAQRDVLDRCLLDIASMYRDVLITQVGAGIDLVNGDDPLSSALVARLARTGTPEHTLRVLDAVMEARTRISSNVNPLLALESMCVSAHFVSTGR